MSEAAIRRAEACFRLASHPSTGEGERTAALARGMGILERHGLDPDYFDIPGRERTPRATITAPPEELIDMFAEIFGSCAGCGAVASVGAMCLQCFRKASAMTCRHGYHGFCAECEGIAA